MDRFLCGYGKKGWMRYKKRYSNNEKKGMKRGLQVIYAGIKKGKAKSGIHRHETIQRNPEVLVLLLNRLPSPS